MPSSEEIRELSEKPHPENHQSVEGMTLTSVEAYVFNSNGKTESQLAFGKHSPFASSENAINAETVGGLASVTKIFTSAALLKLWDNELTAKKSNEGSLPEGQTEYFPQGIQTKLSSFLPALKEKFPNVAYLETIEEIEKDRRESDTSYPGVTLEDLLNHTHGLGSKDAARVATQIMDNPGKLFSCSEVLDLTDRTQSSEFGKFNYSNVGFELAGMIMELISDKTFDQVLEDQIIKPIGAEDQIFTQSKTNQQIGDNRLTGYVYITPCEINGKIYSGQMDCDTSFDTRTAGGLKANPLGIAKFTRRFLAENLDDSLFENIEVHTALWANKGKEGKHNLCGVAQYPDGTFGHNGDGASHETSVRYNPQTGEAFFYRGNGETLTSAVAREMAMNEHPNFKTLPDNQKSELVETKRSELLKGGYDFKTIKERLDKCKSEAEQKGEIFTMEHFQSFVSDLEKDLKSKVGEVPRESFVERLGLERNSKEGKKSFVERMRSDATKGKSRDGHHEL